MASVIDTALTLFSIGLCIPVGVFCLEVLCALFRQRPSDTSALPTDARVAVLVPAHNEAAVIGQTLHSLLPTLPPHMRVIVIADNCTDVTAAIARQCGTEVIERQEPAHHGKGFALDFGIRHLERDPPQAVVFLDADCRVTDQTVSKLAAAAIASQRPVQALNLCDPDVAGNSLQLVSGLAFRFKNLVRAQGLARLANLSHLLGTGMALPWPLAQQAKLASDHLAEDMQLGIELAIAGAPALFLPEARVDSPLPRKQSTAHIQRKRWEHGHLRTLVQQTPRLLWQAVKQRRLDLIWLALDLAIPPLALLVVGATAVMLLAAAHWIAGASAIPLLIATSAVASLGAAVLAGWAIFCRQQVPLVALLAAPLYIAAKLPIYLTFVFKRQDQWVRTERDPAAS
jgi:cellulose synthase/poly-beta-1,6-N-acetylglucosamine synthase-like glycosyltransferase